MQWLNRVNHFEMCRGEKVHARGWNIREPIPVTGSGQVMAADRWIRNKTWLSPASFSPADASRL